MHLIKNSIKIELLQLYRSKLNYLFFVLPIFYSIYITKNNTFEYYALSAYAVQILIFGGMLIGYNVYTNEVKSECKELFFILDYRLTKLISKIISGMIFLTSINLLLIISPIIAGIIWNHNIIIIKECIKYVILYFLLTTIVSFFMGIFIGVLNLKEISYFIMLVTASLMGFIGRILGNLVINNYLLLNVLNKINIGQFDINQHYNNLYGFDTELYRFIHRFTYIIVLLVLILIIYSLKEKLINKKLIISISTMVLVITYLIYILNLTTFVRETNSDYISYMESENYEYEKENFQRENSEVILKNVDIEIDTSRCLEVSGDFTFVTNEKTKDLIFTLYKGFKIKSIKKDNLELKFKQSNNVTQIYLINELKPKENVKLYIEYEGLSAQMYYSSSKAVFLPANFPWLPYMGKELIFFPTYYVPTHLLNNNLVEFNIKYKGNKNYITNLKNSYSSGNEKGLSLIAGNFYKFVNNGTTYISSRFDISSEDTIKSSSKLVEIIDNMRNIIGIENDKFNYICYIDNNNQKVFGNYNSESQIIDNMLIVSLNLLNTDDDYTKEYTTEAIGAIMNSNKDILYKDKTLVDLFHNLFINWYALNYESLKFNPYIPVEDEDYIKNLTHLKSEVSKLSKEQAKEFFTEYYNTLSSEKEVILYDIESILSNVKGEY